MYLYPLCPNSKICAEQYWVPRQEERERKRALKALERLGYAVTLEKVA